MVQVRKSTVIDAPLDAVWSILRDFNAHDRWHPEVTASLVEDGLPSDLVGAVRNFTIRDGGRLREQLIALSDRDHSLTYCLLDTPIPLLGYVATIRLRPVTESDATYWEWESSFDPPPAQARDLANLVGEKIYQAGFDAVRERLAGAGPATGVPAHEARPDTVRGAVRAAPVGAAAGAGLAARAIVVERHGGPEVMAWRAVTAPAPGPGQVRLRHTAIGVNYIDVYCRTGYFDLLTPPGVPGMEAAGVVLDVGEQVTHLREGDRVAYAAPPVGAYATVRTLDATLVVRLPEDIDDDTAAAAMLKGMTAEFLLHRVHRLQPGETVLVHAAAGGVGSLLCQWASLLGARVIGTVSSARKAELAAAAGCAQVIDYRERDFVAAVRDATGGAGAEVIFDGVGADTFARSLDALATRGHLVSYGQAAGPVGSWDLGALAGGSATVSRPNYGHYTGSAREVRSISNHLFEVLRRGEVRVRIGQRFPLAEAARAHRALERRETTGSTLLLP